MELCIICKERWWDLKNDTNGVCYKCNSQVKKDGLALMSKENDMDPFPNGYPFHLPKLTLIEELLISRCHVIMRCYRLKQGHGYQYKGHCLNLEQDPSEIWKKLPLPVNGLPIMIIRKRDEKNPSNYKDFKVRRGSVLAWLRHLQQHSPLYRDI